jgi:hypothetical protein
VFVTKALAMQWAERERAGIGERRRVSANPDIEVNCPYCGARLVYLRTEGETHYYRCARHGVLIVSPDGRIRQQPA